MIRLSSLPALFLLLLAGCATATRTQTAPTDREEKHPDPKATIQTLDTPPKDDRFRKAHTHGEQSEENAWRNLAQNTQAEAAQFAILHHASQLPPKTAIGIWTQLWYSSPHPAVRTAALTELFKHQQDPQRLPQLNLRNRDREVMQALRTLTYQSTDGRQRKTLEALVTQFQDFSPGIQVMFLFACAQQGQARPFAPALRQALKAPQEQVLIAALATTPELGDTSDLPILMNLAAQHPAHTVRAAAQTVIQQLNWPTLNALIASYLTAPTPQDILAIRLLAARRCTEYNGKIADLYHSRNQTTAAEAVKAMATLGTDKDIPGLQQLIQHPEWRRQAQMAIDAIRHRAPPKTHRP